MQPGDLSSGRVRRTGAVVASLCGGCQHNAGGAPGPGSFPLRSTSGQRATGSKRQKRIVKRASCPGAFCLARLCLFPVVLPGVCLPRCLLLVTGSAWRLPTCSNACAYREWVPQREDLRCRRAASSQGSGCSRPERCIRACCASVARAIQLPGAGVPGFLYSLKGQEGAGQGLVYGHLSHLGRVVLLGFLASSSEV